MAKILGTKLFGSTSEGRLIGVGFVYYGSGYPGARDYQRARSFQPKVQDVPRFFIDRNWYFGASFLFWDDMLYAYQMDYETWCTDEECSGREGFMEDTTWLKVNPLTLGYPALLGVLDLTRHADHITVKWECVGCEPNITSDHKTIYLFRRHGVWHDPDAGWERIPRIEFDPACLVPPGDCAQTLYQDYDFLGTDIYQYRFYMCSARIFQSDTSAIYTSSP